MASRQMAELDMYTRYPIVMNRFYGMKDFFVADLEEDGYTYAPKGILKSGKRKVGVWRLAIEVDQFWYLKPGNDLHLYGCLSRLRDHLTYLEAKEVALVQEATGILSWNFVVQGKYHFFLVRQDMKIHQKRFLTDEEKHVAFYNSLSLGPLAHRLDCLFRRQIEVQNLIRKLEDYLGNEG